MPRLVKRSPVTPPKPLPQRGHEEEEIAETTLCKVENTPQEKSEPLMGYCKNCMKSAANSWVDKLCYRCHQEAAGLIFDDEIKRWVDPKTGKPPAPGKLFRRDK